MNDVIRKLQVEVERLSSWLHNDALPLWLSAGVDAPNSGFFERIGQDGVATDADNRRSRVHPRQIYCFAKAGAMGWQGEWKQTVEAGIEYYDRVYRREDGFYGSLAGQSGKMIDHTFDLYNQAFSVFAAAQIAVSIPDRFDEMRQRALGLMNTLVADYHHPLGGFEEANPPKLPLCSNPHMHLFEAMLAWETVDPETQFWSTYADEIANLALTKFIDGKTGALREFFDHDWKPYPGDKGMVVEPGHQFEWSWLMGQWADRRQNGDGMMAAKRLFQIAVDCGVCEQRKVAIMSLYDDFSVHDSLARLWPQTEWIKSALLFASLSKDEERVYYLQSALRAIDALRPFLETPIKGLWYDKWPEGGTLIDEPAPASTFYHILCACYEAEKTISEL
ncbi:AGE family epimerase/isomerase [Brucella neotomae]|uniref:Phosphomannose isomerase n=1 Tax=Brucella neotomae 5K33 TaxID=520456 RepID=A0A7U8K8Q9_BRUNE|nr:AGE family epimerase/isomerase [Brucella neotomae]EEY04140.1 phosphomannose isomerase [Brucella neotomae 5K33]KEX97514.1 mannose-6-phosphate isomerase [Brucella neotomae 5K33]KFJ58747.1 N-acylglucosamine 2-epimerase family protein [Brucella neotomae 5K33]SPU65785.1 phosphomannose isomerase [Brucella neotomae]SPU69485.1 phosphomannose isomerase [Brucella neotomae]